MSDVFESGKKHLFTQSNYLLDLDYLQRLEKSALPTDLTKTMTHLGQNFLKTSSASLSILEKALIKGDKKAASKIVRSLLNESKRMGASYMIELCEKLEKNLADRHLTSSRSIGAQLSDSFLVTRDQVLAYIDRFPKA